MKYWRQNNDCWPKNSRNLGRAETVLRDLRKALLVGSALGCSIVIAMEAAPAQAQSCTPMTAGSSETVTCSSGAYTSPISVTSAVQDLTVVLDGGLNASAGVSAVNNQNPGTVSVSSSGGSVSISSTTTGIYAQALNGSVAIDVTGNVGAASAAGSVWGVQALAGGDVTVHVDGPITASGDTAYGVVANSTGGYVTVNVGDVAQVQTSTSAHGAGISVNTPYAASITAGNVTTSGAYSAGVQVNGAGGYYATSIKVNSVKTNGFGSTGISFNGKGSAVINVGSVTTSGDASHGISVYSQQGGAAITAGAVVTTGANSDGVLAKVYGGPLSVTASSISTSGAYSAGVDAENLGVAPFDGTVVKVGTVTTHGDFSPGINAFSYGGITSVTSDSITTTGKDSFGIRAISRIGTTVTSGDIETSGFKGIGIWAASFGNVVVTSGSITTQGDIGAGIAAQGYGPGDVTVVSGTISTQGARGFGIFADNYYGNVKVTSQAITTQGVRAMGISAEANSASVTVNSGSISTAGFMAVGLKAEGYTGATVTSGSVATQGYEAYGILALSITGDISVQSGSVQTSGDGARGIWASSVAGNVSIQSGTVSTSGLVGQGIRGFSYLGNVNVQSGSVTTSGDHSAGMIVASLYGDVSVSSDSVVTSGFNSRGIIGVDYGPALTVNSGYVRTSGAYSEGILAIGGGVRTEVTVTSATAITSGNYSPAVAVQSAHGYATVNSDLAKTSGAHSAGIYAYGGYGVTVNSGVVATTGDYSAGIQAGSAGGVVTITSNSVQTSGVNSPGIQATGYYGVSVTNTGTVTTTGANSAGIAAISIAQGFYGTGGATVVSDTVMTSGANSPGIVAYAENGQVTVTSHNLTTTGANSDGIVVGAGYVGDVKVVNTGKLYAAQGAGVVISSIGAAEIDNSGSITGGHGAIVGKAANGVTINNAGVINGWVDITSAGTTVNNTGTWNALGDSSFGTGGVFNNFRAVAIAPGSTVATTTTWSGLAAFNNSGLVDLRNGHVGDALKLGGAAWTGTGNSALGVDASLNSALAADKLVVGAAAGSTALKVNDVAALQGGTLNSTGVTVAQAASGSASAFTWGGERKGFVDYELSFNAANVTWNIVGLPDRAAFEMLKAPAMAQSFWQRSGDAWTGREQEIRDSLKVGKPTRGEGWETWAQVLTGGERLSRNETFSVGGSSFSPNLTTSSRWNGFQMGGDYWTGKNLLWGFTAGYLDQRSNFSGDGDHLDLKGWNLGAYAGYAKGRFFANGLVKADWYDVKADLRSVPAEQTFSGHTVGAKGEAGFRLLTKGKLYVEPVVDLAWTSTHLLNAGFVAQDASFDYGDATSLRGSIGARAGGQWRSVRPYVGVSLGQEFAGDNKMTMLTGVAQQCGATCDASLQDLKPGGFARVDFGVSSATAWRGFDWYLKGESEVGAHATGTAGQLGVRWRW